MLIYVEKWSEFSNSVEEEPEDTDLTDDIAEDDINDTNESTTNSLEAIHNDVHFMIGGKYGHMSKLELAGEYSPTQRSSSILIFILSVRSYLLLAPHQH